MKKDLNTEQEKKDIMRDDVSQEQLKELVDDTGKQGNNNWYEVQEGSDNVRVATLKASIKYKIAFAGMMKKNKPYENELDDIFNDEHPRKNGIWIYEDDRKKVLDYLSNIVESKYYIDENGYLQIQDKNKQNNYDKKIESAINGKNIYCIKISSTCYIADEITGEILDYSFEDMDEYQQYEYFEDENKMLIFITENTNKQLENKEIIQNVLDLF